MNYINAIQEYCQKNNVAFPRYNGSSIGPPHNPYWTAVLCSDDKTFKNSDERIFIGNGKTFKEAKQNAAQQAYCYIMSNNTKEKEQIAKINKQKELSNCDQVYIVDLDNYNRFLNDYILGIQEDTTQYDNSLFLVYAYKNNPLIDNPTFSDLGLKINIIDLDDKDATDFYMTFHLGQYLMENKDILSLPLTRLFRSYFILTNDHFGKVLMFIINKYLDDIGLEEENDYIIECQSNLNEIPKH